VILGSAVIILTEAVRHWIRSASRKPLSRALATVATAE
jgi:hypothetical protein